MYFIPRSGDPTDSSSFFRLRYLDSDMPLKQNFGYQLSHGNFCIVVEAQSNQELMHCVISSKNSKVFVSASKVSPPFKEL